MDPLRPTVPANPPVGAPAVHRPADDSPDDGRKSLSWAAMFLAILGALAILYLFAFVLLLIDQSTETHFFLRAVTHLPAAQQPVVMDAVDTVFFPLIWVCERIGVV